MVASIGMIKDLAYRLKIKRQWRHSIFKQTAPTTSYISLRRRLRTLYCKPADSVLIEKEDHLMKR